MNLRSLGAIEEGEEVKAPVLYNVPATWPTWAKIAGIAVAAWIGYKFLVKKGRKK